MKCAPSLGCALAGISSLVGTVPSVVPGLASGGSESGEQNIGRSIDLVRLVSEKFLAVLNWRAKWNDWRKGSYEL